MDIKQIIAIIPSSKLEAVEKKLQFIGVERINVTKVKGYGEYRNFFERSWMVEEVKVEIFTRNDEVEKITAAIMDAAHTGLAGDGIVAVLPTEKFFLVRTKSEATLAEFWPPRKP